MKTLFKMALPVAAFVLASAGAVSTKVAETAKTDDTVLINGWVQNPDENTCVQRTNLNCSISVTPNMCQAASPTAPGTLVQAFDKHPATGKCSRALYRIN